MGNHLFVIIFSVLDVSFAVNSCINQFFLHLTVFVVALSYERDLAIGSVSVRLSVRHILVMRQN